MKIEDRVYKCLCRGISETTWNKFNTLEKEDYIKSHPHSKWADPNATLPTQIKNPVNKSIITPEMRNALNNCVNGKIIENEDGSIDIDGHLSFYDTIGAEDFDALFLDEDGHLKVNFNKVSGYFNFPKSKKLSSLEGSPKEVGRGFSCWGCEGLKSLRGAPMRVGEFFECSDCYNLESLEGAPEQVGGDFICKSCELLSSLEGAPKDVGGDFNCRGCINLESLKGCPREVGNNFIGINIYNNFNKNDVKKLCNVYGKII